jgi:large subunit ribosomal protein L17
MRHRNSGRRLGRKSPHRTAMYNNMVTSLLLYGRIETTEAKAKELRAYADSTIQWSVDVVALAAKGEKATPKEKATLLHARRQARLTVKTREAMERLFNEVGPHFASTHSKGKGGYTRMLKTRNRKGDAAPMALVELIGLYQVEGAQA